MLKKKVSVKIFRFLAPLFESVEFFRGCSTPSPAANDITIVLNSFQYFYVINLHYVIGIYFEVYYSYNAFLHLRNFIIYAIKYREIFCALNFVLYIIKLFPKFNRIYFL
jgi:hypothetical protein